jgi:hypothetical protein
LTDVRAELAQRIEEDKAVKPSFGPGREPVDPVKEANEQIQQIQEEQERAKLAKRIESAAKSRARRAAEKQRLVR